MERVEPVYVGKKDVGNLVKHVFELPIPETGLLRLFTRATKAFKNHPDYTVKDISVADDQDHIAPGLHFTTDIEIMGYPSLLYNFVAAKSLQNENKIEMTASCMTALEDPDITEELQKKGSRHLAETMRDSYERIIIGAR